MITAAVLAGGRSSRMGSDKAELRIYGRSFLEKIAGELAVFGEVLISVADQHGAALPGCRTVTDLFKDSGPLSGLYSVLIDSETESLIAVSCDLPLFRSELGEYLVSLLDDDSDAVVPMTSGRIHPLCAVYRQHCAVVFKEQLDKGELRLRDALNRLHTKYVEIADSGFAEMLDRNINTREDYHALGLEDGKL